MGLGNNRDYKTHARRVTNNLARHAAIMNDLVKYGMDRTEASVFAYNQIVKQNAQARFQRSEERKAWR